MTHRAEPGFTVWPAGPFDIPLIAALHADSFTGLSAGQVWDETSVAEILAMPGAYGLLTGLGGESPSRGCAEPAGFLLGRNVAETGEILSLGMVRAWRRRGGARLLLRAAIARASAAAVTRLFLEVAEDNQAARELYAGEGFAAIARRPAYYRRHHGPAVTALVLARDLG
ncbi:MAG TPA: GNAT family N-acetyltransferase [Kiloniellales bacterium]